MTLPTIAAATARRGIDVTEREIALARAFKSVVFVPGSSEKRFARQMSELADQDPARPLTARQSEFMETIAHRFRRQIRMEQN